MAARSKAFPREARLVTPGAFRRVFANADRFSDRYWTVLITPNEVGRPRLGLAIGRRLSPRAVDRNRLKRLARESFRRHQWQLPNVDIVLMARPAARDCPGAVLHGALDRLWQRVIKRCEQSSPAS